MAAGLEPAHARSRVLGEGETGPPRVLGDPGQLGHRSGVEHDGLEPGYLRVLIHELHAVTCRCPFRQRLPGLTWR
jgi:hypothetical protein